MKARLHFSLLAALFAALPTASLIAHADTIIRLEGTRLVGLPQQYAPAELDLKAFRIRIRDQTKEFSPFLKSVFQQPYDLQLSASWYHERFILPPYLSLRILPKGKDFNYEILFEIEAVRVIKVEVSLRGSATIARLLPVALSDSDISKATPGTR